MIDLNNLTAVNNLYDWKRLFKQQYILSMKNIIQNKVLAVCQNDEASEFSVPLYDTVLFQWFEKNLYPFSSTLLGDISGFEAHLSLFHNNRKKKSLIGH